MSAESVKVKLWYDDVPPSMNSAASGYGQHWSKRHKTKKRWERIWAGLLRESKLPKGCHVVEAHAVLTVPDRRRRDVDNLVPAVTKPLGDALVAEGIIPDDVAAHFVWGGLALRYVKGHKRTTILLEGWPA